MGCIYSKSSRKNKVVPLCTVDSSAPTVRRSPENEVEQKEGTSKLEELAMSEIGNVAFYVSLDGNSFPPGKRIACVSKPPADAEREQAKMSISLEAKFEKVHQRRQVYLRQVQVKARSSRLRQKREVVLPCELSTASPLRQKKEVLSIKRCQEDKLVCHMERIDDIDTRVQEADRCEIKATEQLDDWTDEISGPDSDLCWSGPDFDQSRYLEGDSNDRFWDCPTRTDYDFYQ